MKKRSNNLVFFVLGLFMSGAVQLASIRFYTMESLMSHYRLDSMTDAPPTIDTKQPMANPKDDEAIPQWMTNYFSWHREMRLKFPDKQLFEHPDAPKILVRLCTWQCGGLNDRLSGIPLDLYVANLTGRLLLIKWTYPVVLEAFMIPNKLNWTVPFGVGFDFSKETKKIPSFPYTRGGGTVLLDAIEQALTGDLSTQKVFRSHSLAGGGPIVDALNEPPIFGHIFHTFFQPSQPIRAIIDRINTKYNLANGMYTAVHCRIRHPKGVPRCQGLAGREGGPADRTDLSFQASFSRGKCKPKDKIILTGSYKDFAVNIATHAIDCAHFISQNDAIYFFADSSETMAFMTGTESPFAGSSVSIASSYTESAKVLHIDRQPDHNVSDYYGIFVDIFMASQAQCVSYGIGNYGLLAAKISGTNCTIQHRDFAWETSGIQESRRGLQCPPSPHRGNYSSVQSNVLSR
jgi:hypothetical protein